MEEEYRIRILDRSKKPVGFTSEGLLYLHAAKEILSAKRRFESQLTAGRGSHLCVKTVPFYASNLVPGFLSLLHQQDPSVHVTLKIDWAAALFDPDPELNVNCFIHAFDPDPLDPAIPDYPRYRHEFLFDEEIVLATASHNPMLKKARIFTDHTGVPCLSLRDLADGDFLMANTSRRLPEIGRLYLRDVLPEKQIRLCERGFDSLIAQLRYSNYVTFLPDTTMKYCSAAQEVSFFRVAERQLFRPVVLTCPAEVPLNGPVRELALIAREAMKTPVLPRPASYSHTTL
jgi:DNA-binding transcriptional LysR family regulator